MSHWNHPFAAGAERLFYIGSSWLLDSWPSIAGFSCRCFWQGGVLLRARHSSAERRPGVSHRMPGLDRFQRFRVIQSHMAHMAHMAHMLCMFSGNARLWGCASRNTRDITGMVKEQGRGRRASLVKASRLLIFRSHCKTRRLGF